MVISYQIALGDFPTLNIRSRDSTQKLIDTSKFQRIGL